MSLDNLVKRLLLYAAIGISTLLSPQILTGQDRTLTLLPQNSYSLNIYTSNYKPLDLQMPIRSRDSSNQLIEVLPWTAPFNEIYSLYLERREMLKYLDGKERQIANIGDGTLYGSFFIEADILKQNPYKKNPSFRLKLSYEF